MATGVVKERVTTPSRKSETFVVSVSKNEGGGWRTFRRGQARSASAIKVETAVQVKITLQEMAEILGWSDVELNLFRVAKQSFTKNGQFDPQPLLKRGVSPQTVRFISIL